MKKHKKRRIYRKLFRFIFFLGLVFFIAFFLAGGTSFFSPRTWQNVGEFLSKLEAIQPANQQDDSPK